MPAGGQIAAAASKAAGIIEGGVQTYSSLRKLKQDKEELAKLKTPYYKIQDEYYQNRNEVAGMAQGGLPAATKDYYTNESQRGLGAGISGILSSGGGPSDISHLFDSYDKSIERISAADADAHLKNIQYFNQVNKDLAGQKTIQWGVNEYKPYQDKLSELTARRAADEKSAWNGVNGMIGGLTAAGTAGQNQDMLKGITTGSNPMQQVLGSATGGKAPNNIPSALDEPFNPRSMSPEMQKFYNEQMNQSSNTPTTDTGGDNTELYQQFLQFLKQGGKT